ncbi:MAG: DUF3943 domain-containing protein [Myxococcaceae bacterium]|nr:DUF3943 domain-containing protein [Myxococcaceae bacterium]
MKARHLFSSVLILALALALSGQAEAQVRAPPEDAPLAMDDTSTSPVEVVASPEEKKSPLQKSWNALGQVTTINAAVWSLDMYVLHREWARISVDSWKRNLQVGFVWDADGFGTNQFAHPYHGSLYYNAARESGFGYVGASLFTLLGSLQWELLAETEHPSLNDLINTSLGGIALGEALHRLTSRVLNNRTRGMDRFGRELTGAALSPARGVNRLVSGEAWRIDSTRPSEHLPLLLHAIRSGYQNLREGAALAQGRDQLFVQFDLQYGDPVYDVIRQPFDAYSATVQFITNSELRLVSHAQVRAMLASTPLVSTERSRLVLGALQHFYYTNIEAYSVGGQSFSGSLLYGRALSRESGLRTALHLKGVVLGSISSAHSLSTGRDYDYGPGLALELNATYLYRQWTIASAQVDMAWMYTLNGAGTHHQLQAGRLEVDLPVYRRLGMGVGIVLFRRHSQFQDLRPLTQYSAQLRGFLSVH